MVIDSASSYKIDNIVLVKNFLNPEGNQNSIILVQKLQQFCLRGGFAFWWSCIGKVLRSTGQPRLVFTLSTQPFAGFPYIQQEWNRKQRQSKQCCMKTQNLCFTSPAKILHFSSTAASAVQQASYSKLCSCWVAVGLTHRFHPFHLIPSWLQSSHYSLFPPGRVGHYVKVGVCATFL